MPLHEDVVAGGDAPDIIELGRVVLDGGIGERACSSAADSTMMPSAVPSLGAIS
jgi:hypothetical protein